LEASTGRFGGLGAGCGVLPYEFTINREQDSSLLWPKARIGLDRLGDTRRSAVCRCLQDDVPKRAGQGSWARFENALSAGDRVRGRRRPASQPLGDSRRGEAERSGEAAAGHAGIIKRLLQRLPEGFSLLRGCQSPNTPLGHDAKGQACLIGRRPVESVACRLTPDSYQATFAQVVVLLARCRDVPPNEGASA